MQTKGKVLIWVFSVLILISAVLISYIAFKGMVGGTVTFLLVMMLLLGIFKIVCGVIGLIDAAKPEKANTIIWLGVSMVVLSILSTILTFTSGSSVRLYHILSTLLLPVFYLIGGLMNRRTAQ